MRKPTIILHESLIRLARGMLKAWEAWLGEMRENDKHG
jgi:hypothetical protein